MTGEEGLVEEEHDPEGDQSEVEPSDSGAEPDGWYEDYAAEESEPDIDEYEITATPNDFNVLTIKSFIESGAIKIPGFQRNYVWDIRRASKLIESLIRGLPVPQLFLYEEDRNTFLVMDGQQRMMSIYYFMSQRFPRRQKRSEIRRIFDENGKIPESIFYSDDYFMDFRLRLGGDVPNAPKNRFAGKRYSTLGEYQATFDLRPIRNIIVKQTAPDESEQAGYDSAVFEIFHRLNTGGVNLRPQEIRGSLYHSEFYDMLIRANMLDGWRKFVNTNPDLHMKDIEILLRAFAMLLEGAEYRSSMLKFLNMFSKKAKRFDVETVGYFESLFKSFLDCTSDLPGDVFLGRHSRRFNIALFEAVFTGACAEAVESRRLCARRIQVQEIADLALDSGFQRSSAYGTTNKENVETRLEIGRRLIQPC